MRIFSTRSLFAALLVTSLLGLSACEPKGPADDIGDNIDKVNENNQLKENSQLKDNNPVGPVGEDGPFNDNTSAEPISTPDRPLRPVRELPLENEPTTDHAADDAGAKTHDTAPSTNDAVTGSAGAVVSPDNTGAPVAGTVKEQQEEQAQQSAESKAVAKEADQKLDEILKETSDQP